MSKVIPPNPTIEIVDTNRKMSQQFRDFTQAVARESVLFGDGPPEGVVTAQITRLYMNESGASGFVLWIKQKKSVGGNPARGWVPIG